MNTDLMHQLKCNNCKSKWYCCCGDMKLHDASTDLNRCPLCSATCAHCGNARVTGRWSELCADCVATVRRETAQFIDDHAPDDAHDWGIPGPEVADMAPFGGTRR